MIVLIAGTIIGRLQVRAEAPAVQHDGGAMPHFYFDVFDGVSMRDNVGCDLPDIRAAQKEAATRAAAVLAEAPERLWKDGDWTVWVRDEAGLQLFSVVVLGMLAPSMRA